MYAVYSLWYDYIYIYIYNIALYIYIYIYIYMYSHMYACMWRYELDVCVYISNIHMI